MHWIWFLVSRLDELDPGLEQIYPAIFSISTLLYVCIFPITLLLVFVDMEFSSSWEMCLVLRMS
jgi:hypothetical protein